MILANTVPWDGSVGGRVDAIMKYTEPANKLLVRNFLAHVTPLKAVVAECRKSAIQPHSKYQNQLEGNSNPETGVMLVSRYRDNIYLLLLNVQSELIEQVKTFVSLFLHKVYNLKLKWEPHGEVAVWGEGELRATRRELSLSRKGITLCLTEGGPKEWDRWVDVFSPHSRLVWKSHFPSLLLKCVWFAGSEYDIVCNMRSLMWGVGSKKYPKHWWRPALLRFVAKYGLKDLLPYSRLQDWVRQGAASEQAKKGGAHGDKPPPPPQSAPAHVLH